MIKLAKPSLKEIGFEAAPFQTHILILQSKIREFRMENKTETVPQKKVELVKDKHIKNKQKKAPEVRWIPRPPAATTVA